MHESWKPFLDEEFSKPYFQSLSKFLHEAYASKDVFPAKTQVFRAFTTDLDAVKVVILGQDPYHTPGAAHGLAFSVPNSQPIPPSLVNIYKEIENDLGRPSVTNGDLTHWAEQGVLLLNATLTVRAHAAASHVGRGWETFTDAVIRTVATRDNVVYMLWGSYAQRKAEFVDPTRNLILKSVHPSPLSAHRGFFGNHHFSRANEYLVAHGMDPIEW